MEFSFQSVNGLFEKSFIENWEFPALSDFKGETLRYADLAREIGDIHCLFRKCGLKKGDRIAVCGKNRANWVVAFMSALTYGAVPVPILHEFKPGNIHHLVNHSGSRFLFTDNQIWENLSENEMPGLDAVVQLSEMEVVFSRNPNMPDVGKSIIADGGKTDLPAPSSLGYHADSPEELALISYTSGTSGFSKGVMLPYRSLASNLEFSQSVHGQMRNDSNIIAILPSAHLYGLMFEILYQLTRGVHIHLLTRVPSPKIIMQAMTEIRPDLIISVPLIIEKIYKNMLKPELEKAGIRTMCKWLPGFEQFMLVQMRKRLIEAFGGRFAEIIIGGAAFNREVESFFHKMRFPFTVGYGMTECGPIITYVPWKETRVGSSGKAAPNMEIRIDSADPERIPGEIQCRGANVFLGYWKNEEVTRESFTEDGWFRTGDMGIIDADGYLFIRGRNKCMILGPNGQNIYPEELETSINNLPYVIDSLVVEDDSSLTAIIYPDFQGAEKDGMDSGQLQRYMESLMTELNKDFPNYAKIKKVEIIPEDFERTPKRSIKRYLYQRI